MVAWSKRHAVLWMGASHCKSAPCLVWCSWVFWRWRYIALDLSRDLIWPTHWELMRIYGWECLVLSHYPWKSCDQKHWDGGDMFLICHMTSCEHMFKGLREFMVSSPSQCVAILPCLVAIGLVQVRIKSIYEYVTWLHNTTWSRD